MTIEQIKAIWDTIAVAIAEEYPYLAPVVLNRKVQFEDDVVVMQFSEEEKMIFKIAKTYQAQMQKKLQEVSQSDVSLGIAWRNGA
ncbi:MAG: hypothetical protein E7264_12125 [Lachnospiraceae bacterium]|nr:hypothetical protein [Lachnospiraceae bacterium]